ncbi:MAG: transposase [Verrucomicrobiales bacterium]|nr:transposase [Verrucomicrobiales bacterium]
MSQSLAQIIVHLVFSTKNREAWLSDDNRDDLHAYICGIVEKKNGCLLNAGSVADHIHLLISHPRPSLRRSWCRKLKPVHPSGLKRRVFVIPNLVGKQGTAFFR